MNTQHPFDDIRTSNLGQRCNDYYDVQTVTFLYKINCFISRTFPDAYLSNCAANQILTTIIC